MRRLSTSRFAASRPANVDIFRLKWYIEDAISRSGVPHVMLRPTAFMDVWIDEVFVVGHSRERRRHDLRRRHRVANYIAVDDVAEFAVKILAREEMRNEVVEAGGRRTVAQRPGDASSSASRKSGNGGTCRSP